MLSLTSSSTTRLTGTRVFVNWVMVCGSPSSKSSNSSCVRSVTSRPSASVTATVTVTTSMLDSNRCPGVCASTPREPASMPSDSSA